MDGKRPEERTIPNLSRDEVGGQSRDEGEDLPETQTTQRSPDQSNRRPFGSPPPYSAIQASVFEAQPRSMITNNSRNTETQEIPPRPPPYYTQMYHPQPPIMANYMNPFGQMGFFQNPILDYRNWAPYPRDIPPGIPPGLAHLLSVDNVLIVEQVNLIELFMSYSETCKFMVLNDEGLCIFYAYETSSILSRCCCGEGRPLQIHVKDLYQNEIIYMNRLCTCALCCSCCCLSALEVYTIPLSPVGAVIQNFYLNRVQFDIIDVNENVLFKIQGPSYCRVSTCFFEFQFTIHALDAARTEVGMIRKQWGGSFREILSSADIFTASFPRDMDVRIKAIILGAVFLINYLYAEDN